MSVRPIITVPDPILESVSAPVESVTDSVRSLVDDMVASMRAHGGVGLAAVQIGVPLRIVVADLPSTHDDGDAASDSSLLRLVNPEILSVSSDTSVLTEGCLSVPDYYEDVTRPARCRIAFSDVHGVRREMDCDGFRAACIQHEIDHLNGILFIDRLSRLKRDMTLKRMRKSSRRSAVTDASVPE